MKGWGVFRIPRAAPSIAQPASFGAFEEPPRMSSERNASQRKSEDAKQRAARAREPFFKSAYEKAAECWTVLARIDSLVHEQKDDETPKG